VEVWHTSNLRPLRLNEEKKEERKKEERKKKPQDENIMVCPIPSGDHKETTAQKYNGLPYYIGRP